MKNEVLQQIKQIILAIEPRTEVWLYGSYARGNAHAHSDVDLLVLMPTDTLSPEEKKRIAFALYELEFEHQLIISPLIMPKKQWEQQHIINGFYQNVKKDAVLL